MKKFLAKAFSLTLLIGMLFTWWKSEGGGRFWHTSSSGHSGALVQTYPSIAGLSAEEVRQVRNMCLNLKPKFPSRRVAAIEDDKTGLNRASGHNLQRVAEFWEPIAGGQGWQEHLHDPNSSCTGNECSFSFTGEDDPERMAQVATAMRAYNSCMDKGANAIRKARRGD